MAEVGKNSLGTIPMVFLYFIHRSRPSMMLKYVKTYQNNRPHSVVKPWPGQCPLCLPRLKTRLVSSFVQSGGKTRPLAFRYNTLERVLWRKPRNKSNSPESCFVYDWKSLAGNKGLFLRYNCFYFMPAHFTSWWLHLEVDK